MQPHLPANKAQGAPGPEQQHLLTTAPSSSSSVPGLGGARVRRSSQLSAVGRRMDSHGDCSGDTSAEESAEADAGWTLSAETAEHPDGLSPGVPRLSSSPSVPVHERRCFIRPPADFSLSGGLLKLMSVCLLSPRCIWKAFSLLPKSEGTLTITLPYRCVCCLTLGRKKSHP